MSRDRTNEFFTAVKLVQNKPQYLNSDLRNRQNLSNVKPINQNYSRFMLGAKSISKELHLTYEKLGHLTEICSNKPMNYNDDRNRHLNELVYIIKQNITSLNQQIENLRKNQIDNTQNSKNMESHSKNVVLNLQQRLASMSNDFKSTLEIRTENMKHLKERQEQFSNIQQVAIPNKLINRGNTVIDFENDQSQMQVSSLPQQQKQLLFDNTADYIEERATAMQSIECTIVELGSIFNQLATMVQHQEEMITRIDSNVTDASLNVEAAHESLLRYFNTISNNRWLMLKVFGVLFFFFIFFIIFS